MALNRVSSKFNVAILGASFCQREQTKFIESPIRKLRNSEYALGENVEATGLPIASDIFRNLLLTTGPLASVAP